MAMRAERNFHVVKKIINQSKAAQDARAEKSSQSVSNTNHSVDGTPSRPTVRAGSYSELLGSRCSSRDLINDQFGHLVSLKDARDILPHLVECNLLQVISRPPIINDEDMYDYALSRAQEHISEAKFDDDEEKVLWKWSKDTTTDGLGTELGFAQFLNTVAFAAYIISVRLGEREPDRKHLKTRLVRNPYPDHALPLASGDEQQDYRPDFVGLDSSCFCECPSPNTSFSEVIYVGAPVTTIKKHFGRLLDKSTEYYLSECIGTGTHTDADCWDLLTTLCDEEAQMTGCMLQRMSWPEVVFTGVAKETELIESAAEALTYARAQRRVQAWLEYTIGLVATKTRCGMLRADPAGVEQCLLDLTSSHGVLEVVRLALGILLSGEDNLGLHPAFTLKHIERDLPDQAIPIAKEQRPGCATVEIQATKLKHRTVAFIKLDSRDASAVQQSSSAPSLPAPYVNYYVHRLMEDRGSLIGRSTRIFVVSRETTSDRRTRTRQFDGPFILKMQYATSASTCYTNRIIEKVAALKLPHVLAPSHMWYNGNVLARIRHLTEEQIEGVNKPSVLTFNREELFSQTTMQLSLPDYFSWGEFVAVFIDVLTAIDSLAKHHVLHRDISVGNVLIKRPYDVANLLQEARKDAPLFNFRCSTNVDPASPGGLLHDFDMAGTLDPAALDALLARMEAEDQGEEVQPEAERQERSHRTGTLWYMSTRLLKHGGGNLLADDVHSIFFVAYMFFLEYTPRVEEHGRCGRADIRNWPESVKLWTTSAGKPEEAGGTKTTFFESKTKWMTVLKTTAPLWFPNSQEGRQRSKKYMDFLLAIYGKLWTNVEDGKYVSRDYEVQPRHVIDAIEEYRSKLSKEELEEP